MFPKMKISQQNKLLAISFGVFIFFSIIYSLSQRTSVVENEKLYADTLIPKGFVLVPIEISNIDAVAALINQFGIIDLYAGSPQSQGSVKIASRIKVLRAPLNPHQYAVMVTEQVSANIMKNAGPFWAVVQNNKSEQNEIKKENKTVKIEYYKGT